MQIIGYNQWGLIEAIIPPSTSIVTIPDDMTNGLRYRIWDEWEMGPLNPQTQLRPRINTIPPYVPVVVIPAEISRRQFFQQLAIIGLISQDEALAAVSTGTIPAAMLAIVNSLPSEQQFNAKMILSAQSFLRSNPLVEVFRAAQNLTSDQVDQIWLAASLI